VVERTIRRRAPVALVLLAFACGPATNDTPPRYLDQICDGNPTRCVTRGNARLVGGPTVGTIGATCGPGAGDVDVALPLLHPGGGWTVDVLVAGHGVFCVNECGASYPLTEDARWITVVAGPYGGEDAGPAPTRLVLHTKSNGSALELDDLRVTQLALQPGCY
jgi:hypothetical protein